MDGSAFSHLPVRGLLIFAVIGVAAVAAVICGALGGLIFLAIRHVVFV